MFHKFMSRIANMSNKEAKWFILSFTFVFVLFLSILVWGLILVIPGEEIPTLSLVLILVGGIFLFITIIFLALASLSSNYMKRKEKANKEE